MRIVLIGIQGSGKSTQGNLLSKKLGIPYLSTGHIFRDLARKKSKLGRYIKETMSAGYLILDERTIEIVKDYLAKEEYKKGYILDGFPRTLAQANAFKDSIDKVIYLCVSDAEALKRLLVKNGQEGRPDNTARAIEKRIELFHKLTKPVLKFYKEKGLLATIDGERSIEAIHADILRAFEKEM